MILKIAPEYLIDAGRMPAFLTSEQVTFLRKNSKGLFS